MTDDEKDPEEIQKRINELVALFRAVAQFDEVTRTGINGQIWLRRRNLKNKALARDTPSNVTNESCMECMAALSVASRTQLERKGLGLSFL